MDSRELFKNYSGFVDGVTSQDSKDFESFIKRLNELNETVNVPRLLTAGLGLGDEGGEFSGLVKKVVFHGKEYNKEIEEHLTKELGDIMWYWMQACITLNVDPVNVINGNIKKLESRYPGGKFNVFYAENRDKDDI